MKINKVLMIIPLLAVGSLAGCKPDPYAGRIKIRFLHNVAKGELTTFMENAAQEFNDDPELNPDLKYYIDASQESGSYDDLVTKTIDSIATDGYCDIFYGYPDSIQKLIKRSIVYDINDFIEDEEYGLSDEELADILPNYLQEGRNYPIEGTYSMPLSKSSEVMYVNGNLVGFNLSKYSTSIGVNGILTKSYLDNLTWEELFENLCPTLDMYMKDPDIEDSRKLIKPYNNKLSYISYDSDSNFFITLAKQYGYDYTEIVNGKGEIKFNNENMARLLLKLNSYYNKPVGNYEGSSYLTTGMIIGGTKSSYGSDMFNNNACLFTISSTAGAKNNYNSNFESVPVRIPHAEVNGVAHRDVISQGPSVALLDHGSDERGLGAWLFYKYFLTQKSTSWSVGTKAGYLPITRSGYESEEYQERTSKEGKQAGELEYNLAVTYEYVARIQNNLFDSPVFDQSGAARTQAGSALTQSILLKNATLDGIMSILNSCKNIAMNG